MDEFFSMKSGKSTGNCFHYNRIEVQLPLPTEQSSIKYFAYTVPEGVYVWSAFNGTPAPGTPAFIALGGRAVYFGDYIHIGDHAIDRHSNLAAAQTAMQSVLPKSFPVYYTHLLSSSAVHLSACKKERWTQRRAFGRLVFVAGCGEEYLTACAKQRDVKTPRCRLSSKPARSRLSG